MQVAFLTGSTHGIPRLGGEARIYHIARTLASSGIQVDLYGSRFDNELISSHMSQRQSFAGWSGGDWYPLSLKSSLAMVKNLPSITHRRRTFVDYDAILTELGTAWQILFNKWIVGVPLVLDEHNVEWDLLRQQELSTGRPQPWRRLRSYERICHRVFDHVLVVSRHDEDVFEAEGTSKEKMRVIPNGVDTSLFHPDFEAGQLIRKRIRVGPDTPLLMYMGSMKFFPNVDAVDALLGSIFPKSRQTVPSLRLMLTGPGTTELPVTNDDETIVTGVVERTSLPSYINAADICLAPLRFGSGTRFKILEWMACGKAIVATKKAVEGIEVTHQDNIILEDNVSKYPGWISELALDVKIRERLGTRARAFIEERYSWEKCIQPLGELLRNL